MKEKDESIFFALLTRPDFPEGVCWWRRVYHGNETILREGERSGKVFLVLSGCVRILGRARLHEDYQIRPGVRDLGPGEVFGELSMLDSGSHSATAVAVSECVLAEIDSAKLLDYLDRQREFGYLVYREIARELVDRLRKTDKQFLATLAWGLKAHGYEKYLKTDE